MYSKVLVGSLIVLLVLPLASAQFQEANSSIQQAQKDIQEMEEAGLPTKRVNDLFVEANSTYHTQLFLNQSGKEPDLSEVISTTNKINSLKKSAFKIKDELDTLEERINELEKSNINLSKVKSTFRQAEKEFEDERYELAGNKIEKTYEQISTAQAATTKIKAFYEATGKTLYNFVKNNYKKIVVAVVVIIIVSFVFYRKLKIRLLEKKKKELKHRKKVLQDLIKKSQYNYFDKGRISESTYKTRTSKYGEMIRDINRQLPLINQELTARKSKLI